MTRPDILDTAKKCVCGQREQDYGSPEDNFGRIAELWNAYLGSQVVDAVDVSMMMALLKIARIKSGTGTDDSFVDLAGYAACGGEISAAKLERQEFDRKLQMKMTSCQTTDYSQQVSISGAMVGSIGVASQGVPITN